MRTVALNGTNYALDPWMPAGVEVHPELFWTRPAARKWAQALSEPVRLIGFSRGAAACLAAAKASEHVVSVFAHSPMYWGHRNHREYPLTLIRTAGDQTPPYRQADSVASAHRGPLVFRTLDPLPWPAPPTTLTERLMVQLGHQFHNCLPHLDVWLAQEDRT